MNELFDFMLEKIGGLEKAKQELLRSRLAEIDILGMTVSELLETAHRGGWDDLLRNLTLEQFSEIFEEAERIALKAGEPAATSGSLPVERAQVPPPRRRPPLGQSRARVRAIKKRVAETGQAPKPDHPVLPAPVMDIAEQQRESLLGFLGEHPWIYREELEKGVDVSVDVLESRLQELVDRGLVRTVPAEKGDRYALG